MGDPAGLQQINRNQITSEPQVNNAKTKPEPNCEKTSVHRANGS